MSSPEKLVLAIAIMVGSFWFTAIAAKPAVLAVFADGDFIPHMPSVKDAKTQLGSVGQMREVRKDNGAYYVYRVAQRGWLVLYASEAKTEKYPAIEQVLYTEIEPASWSANQPVGKKLVSNRLDGIALGCDVMELRSKKIRLDVSPSTLFGVKVDVYEYVPFKEQDDLRYRFFARDGRVVAFSVLVTE